LRQASRLPWQGLSNENDEIIYVGLGDGNSFHTPQLLDKKPDTILDGSICSLFLLEGERAFLLCNATRRELICNLYSTDMEKLYYFHPHAKI
jgi:hypothetical protein